MELPDRCNRGQPSDLTNQTMRYVGISCARDHAELVTKDKAGFMEQFKASPNDGTVIVPPEYRRLG